MTPALFDRYKGSVGVDYSGCQKGSSFGIDDGSSVHIHKYLVYPMNGTSIDITLITAGAMNRLVLFPIIASRWSGSAPPIPLTRSPILFVLHVKEEEEATLQSTLRSPDYTTLCQPRITLLVYLSSATAFFHSNYPINILRNLGIRQVRTSHFLLLDMDMWLSGIPPSIPSSADQSYEVLLALPPVIWQDPKAAVVIPAWFHTGWTIANGTLPEQVNSWG